MNTVFGKYDEIQNLNKQIQTCTCCPLHTGRINAVCGEGKVNARLFFIAQAPGEMKDKAGKMFIGPTGKILDGLFSEIKLNRNEVYMTNLIKCRLPNNRKPNSEEIQICGKYLEQEIQIVKPEYLIPLGQLATSFTVRLFCHENFFNSHPAGKLISCNRYKIYPLRHPSAVLYNPALADEMKLHFNRILLF